ncbi:CPBP family intramembrane metalloprotease [Streptococcus didelphis]|uniref:CPBP family intramembrane metalloprotease n=1 Tax=Streptococcus didelphis TaxID=102886 RepID=A0ABY9LIS1_9STRE|nr:type II CAAX endopeptidase family protein [Streptococcus didelphis]WMB28739.1 CPBP family intramembrane metalloprotease [Streptococcus didelphis]
MNNDSLVKKQSLLKTIVIVIAAILLLIVAQLIASLPFIGLAQLGYRTPQNIADVLIPILYALVTITSVWFICNKILKSNLSEYRISNFKIRKEGVFLAFLLPIVVILLFTLLVPGNLVVEKINGNGWITLFTGFLETGIVAAIVEEILFRGLILRTLENYSSKITAAIISAFAFGAVHVLTAGLPLLDTVLAIIGIMCSGVFFALVAQNTNSIWTGVLIHCVWNTIDTSVFPVSLHAKDYQVPFNYIMTSKSTLLTGGGYGIEASIICALVFILLTIALVKKKSS